MKNRNHNRKKAARTLCVGKDNQNKQKEDFMEKDNVLMKMIAALAMFWRTVCTVVKRAGYAILKLARPKVKCRDITIGRLVIETFPAVRTTSGHVLAVMAHTLAICGLLIHSAPVLAQDPMEMQMDGPPIEENSQLLEQLMKGAGNLKQLGRLKQELELDMTDVEWRINDLQQEAEQLAPNSLERRLTDKALDEAQTEKQLAFINRAGPLAQLFKEVENKVSDPIREQLNKPEAFQGLHRDFLNEDLDSEANFALAFLVRIAEARQRLEKAIKVAMVSYTARTLDDFREDYENLTGANTDTEARKMVADMFRPTTNSGNGQKNRGRIGSIIEKR